MSSETPPGYRGKLFTAVQALCVAEAERLFIDVRFGFEYANLASIPGALYPVEFRDVTFSNYGLPASNLDYYVKDGTLSQLQLETAFVVANDIGMMLSRDVKRMRYKHPHCREIANYIFATLNHSHRICEQTPYDYPAY